MTPEEIKAYCEQHGVRFVDIKFVDLFGQWQHITRPIRELNDWTDYNRSPWRTGYGFDGSSIRGFQKIEESDMLLVPDPETAFIDPFIQVPTLSVIANVEDPVTREAYTRDARYIAKKAEQYLRETGVGDTVYIGPELEFFIFDEVRFSNQMHTASYIVDSDEGIWNSSAESTLRGDLNQGYRPRVKGGYFPVAPHDTQTDIRNEMVEVMEQCGIQVELHHHEVATAGQGEIDMRFDTLTRMGDKALLYKYIVKNVAKRNGQVATFMPKPLFGDNGSGMHTHLSIWKNGVNLFAGEEYAGISKLCKHYIAGLIRHGRALMAIAAPTTNSYKRLVPGYEAPVNLVYSARNRSAACRIPL
ncbi:MAG: type I glutamate--ammonia ligase, partial [Chloroflexota bacterium]